jgi:hypothetical protein
VELAKAKLQEVTADPEAKPQGDPLEVQFNPTTLRLQLSNVIEGGESLGRQVRQFVGKSSATLTLDLVFDTADEGTTDEPRSVREKTNRLEYFLKPRSVEGSDKQTPARVRFEWGDLVVTGLIDSLTLDFDLFAANGVPLRAKATLSIKEQDPKWELAASKTRDPDASVRTTLALDGESVADLAARVGLDPSGWKKIAGNLDETLSLTAGVAIDFDVNATASLGLGATAGVELGVGASLEVALGLDASVSVGGSATAGTSLAASGGVAAALETAKIVRTDTAATAARRAFSAPEPGGGAPPATRAPNPTVATLPATPAPARVPLRRTGLPSASERADAPAAAPPPAADPRAVSFGIGVPLRPRADETTPLGGSVALRSPGPGGTVPVTRDPTVPPWEELPAWASAGSPAVERGRHPGGACGCATCSGRRRGMA